MTVQELNIFHTVFELEIAAISFMLKDLLLGFKIVRIFSLHYTSLIAVLTESLFTLKTPLCTLTLLHAIHLIMLLLSRDNNPKNVY